jgi:hypothetical protein
MTRVGHVLSYLAVLLATAPVAAGAESLGRADRVAEKGPAGQQTALPLLRSLVATPDAATHRAAAERLIELAEQNRLTDDFARLAADLLKHEDPFVRGMAEWAIAMRVGGENNGQKAAWPAAHAPAWYAAWAAFPPAAMVEADWVRQAVAQGIHRDSAKLLASVDAMIERASRMAADFDRQHQAATGGRGAQRDPRSRLGSIRQKLAAQLAASPGDLVAHGRLWLEARRVLRAVALANPAIGFDELLFVKQFPPHTSRNITRSYPWKHKPGGDLCVLSGLAPDAPLREVLRGRLGPGHVRGLDLWWDADRAVFGYARQANWPPAVDTGQYAVEGLNTVTLRKTHEPIHLFEVMLDGSGLRQLTAQPYWSDLEPTYCANGDIVFVSDRCGQSAQCGPFEQDHAAVNLYVMSSDGKHVRRLTTQKDYDRYPHSLDNGLIAFTRWEYQERGFMNTHSLWTVRPDGTMADALFKQHMNAPCGLRDTRSIAGSAKMVSIATGHHTYACGPVVVIDPRHGLNSEDGIRIVTPGVRPQEGQMAGRPVEEGGVSDRGGLYRSPWALSESCFLVAYAYHRPNSTGPDTVDSNGFAVYLIDVYGNKELICRDLVLSCIYPIPLKRRPRRPRLPEVTDPTARDATCYVPDVYDGLEGVPRGTIKHLRIAEHVAWPLDAERGAMPYLPGNAWETHLGFASWSPVRVIGTVKVERDGSAHFKLPPDTAVYFQALDERQMEVRRMRSMVSLQPGEVRGCRGCHESDAKAPAMSSPVPLALQRPAEVPAPPPWGPRKLLAYEWLVQPILDRHCVRCHGSSEPDGGLDLSATRDADGFLQSFRTMFGVLPGQKKKGRALVSVSDRFSGAEVTQPKQFGSHRSPLVRVLLDDPLHVKEVALGPAEWTSLVTWVDANAPYYGAFVDKRPADGGPPRRDVLSELPDPFQAAQRQPAQPLPVPR